MLGYLKLLLILYSVSLFYTVIFKYKFATSMLLTYISLAFIMFVAALTGKLSYYVRYLIIFYIALFFIAYLVMVFNRKRNKEIPKLYFRVSALIFFMVFSYLYIKMQQSSLSFVDDFQHWGAVVKDAMRVDKLYPGEGDFFLYNSTLYPPFTTLLEVFFNKVFGFYDESNSLLALSSFSFVCLLPILDRYDHDKKDLIKALTAAPLTILLLLCVQFLIEDGNMDMTGIFNSTYVDYTISLLCLAAFYIILNFKNKFSDYVAFILVNLALAWVKSAAVYFCAITCLCLFVVLIIRKQINFKAFFLFILGIGAVGLIYFIWQKFVMHSLGKSSWERELTTLLKVITFQDPGEAGKQALSNFLKAIWITPLIHTTPINIAYAPVILIVTIFLFVYGNYKKENTIKALAIVHLIGGIGYGMIVCINYVYRYTNVHDQIALAMYPRYAQSYTYFSLLLVFVVVLYYGYKKIWLPILCCLISLIFVEPLSISSIAYDSDAEKTYATNRENIQYFIDNYFDPENNSYLMVSFADPAYTQFVRYMFDENMQKIKTYFKTGENFDEETLYNLIKEYDYIIVAQANEQFEEFWYKYTDYPLYYLGMVYKVMDDDRDGLDFEGASTPFNEKVDYSSN